MVSRNFRTRILRSTDLNSQTKRENYVDPVYYWDPVIAPSGMEVYTGAAIPQMKGNIFVGGLVSQKLVRLVLKDNKVIGEEHLLKDRGQRIRDVKRETMVFYTS